MYSSNYHCFGSSGLHLFIRCATRVQRAIASFKSGYGNSRNTCTVKLESILESEELTLPNMEDRVTESSLRKPQPCTSDQW